MKEFLGLFVLCALTGFIAYSCGRESNRSGYREVHEKYKEINDALNLRDSCVLALLDSAVYYFDDEQRRDYVQQCIEDARSMAEDVGVYDVRYKLDDFEGVLHDAWFE